MASLSTFSFPSFFFADITKEPVQQQHLVPDDATSTAALARAWVPRKYTILGMLLLKRPGEK